MSHDTKRSYSKTNSGAPDRNISLEKAILKTNKGPFGLVMFFKLIFKN